MRFINNHVVMQEVPNEISLAFNITGCPLQCDGCHTPKLRDEKLGTELTPTIFQEILDYYKKYITCVLFLGGEWNTKELVELCDIAKSNDLKTCLYTGKDGVSDEIKSRLDYLKTGAFIKSLGGLNSPTTNQRFINLMTGENMNKYFQRSTK